MDREKVRRIPWIIGTSRVGPENLPVPPLAIISPGTDYKKEAEAKECGEFEDHLEGTVETPTSRALG